MPHFRFSSSFAVALAASCLWAASAAGQTSGPIIDGLSRYQVEAMCSPGQDLGVAVVARILGSRDNAKQLQYSTNDVIVVDAGSSSGLTSGQQLVVQRPFPVPSADGTDRAQSIGNHVSGWLRLTRVESDWSEAQVVYQCGEFSRGDELRALERPTVVSSISGTPMYDRAATVVFGDEGRSTGGATQLMVIDQGSDNDLRIGQRVTLFRRALGPDGPLSPLGEATIVAVFARSATIRLDSSRDAIQAGDSAAPHSGRE